MTWWYRASVGGQSRVWTIYAAPGGRPLRTRRRWPPPDVCWPVGSWSARESSRGKRCFQPWRCCFRRQTRSHSAGGCCWGGSGTWRPSCSNPPASCSSRWTCRSASGWDPSCSGGLPTRGTCGSTGRPAHWEPYLTTAHTVKSRDHRGRLWWRQLSKRVGMDGAFLK